MKSSTEKKIINFICSVVGVLMAFAVGGGIVWGVCSLCNSAPAPSAYSDTELQQLSGKFYVYTDPETRVQYLLYTVNGGITPRLDCSGNVIVSPVGVSE